jgi:hypothetical protein
MMMMMMMMIIMMMMMMMMIVMTRMMRRRRRMMMMMTILMRMMATRRAGATDVPLADLLRRGAGGRSLLADHHQLVGAIHALPSTPVRYSAITTWDYLNPCTTQAGQWLT